jgi:hypothetical protein
LHYGVFLIWCRHKSSRSQHALLFVLLFVVIAGDATVLSSDRALGLRVMPVFALALVDVGQTCCPDSQTCVAFGFRELLLCVQPGA